MNQIYRFRLWCSRWFGPPVGIWQTDDPCMRDRDYCAWRLMSDGRYQYRPLTEAEAREFMESNAW